MFQFKRNTYTTTVYYVIEGIKNVYVPDVVAHTSNPSTWETEAGESLWVLGWPKLHNEKVEWPFLKVAILNGMLLTFIVWIPCFWYDVKFFSCIIPFFFYLHFSKGKLCHTCATILILRLSRLNNVAKVINNEEKSQWSCLSCPIDFSRVWHTLGCIENPVLFCFLYLSSLGIC